MLRLSSYTFLGFYAVTDGANVELNVGGSLPQAVYQYILSCLYVPDVLMVIAYSILSWILLILFQLGVINKENYNRVKTGIIYVL